MTSRRFSATQQTTVRDMQRIMTKIAATSLRIEQDVMGGGVKVVFDRNGKRYVRECSRWPDSLDNLRAIGLQIDYLYRALEVYGVDMSETTFDQEFDNVFAGYLAAPDSSALLLGDGNAQWWEVMGNRATRVTTSREWPTFNDPKMGKLPDWIWRYPLCDTCVTAVKAEPKPVRKAVVKQ